MSETPHKGGHVSPPYGSERQFQIYMAGLQGQLPALPLDAQELERRAKERLSPEAYDYVAGGAGAEDTMQANLAAFQHWSIVPRMLRNIAQRDLSVELLELRLPAPVLLAPIGVQSIIHPEAELAVARAAASLGIPFILSTVSSYTLEEVAQAAGDGPRWFQLYWPADAEFCASLVQRAERAGYGAIVVTLDTRLIGWRPRDLQRAYLPFLQAQGLANYLSDPVFRRDLPQPPEENPFPAIQKYVSSFGHLTLQWEDLAFLRQHTRLPVLLKGILHPDDARRAVECGVDGLIVSNHGGRQVAGAIAALEALPGVVEAVAGRVPVLFDSGIRQGADIVKAVALGARAVLLGRPYIWGLALGGEAGVREVLQNMLADLDLTLALSGFVSVSSLDRSALAKAERA
ncbi:MAG: alpha-hydroxy-acid oxidizing protein [Thermogemmatispora sp.]|uniref:alpha-hydroxy-acid oxidizing protein n=1 Tax=Thermogemmatispora sp. TaxID=1968838 RepID=UPI00261ADF80|nr:alpha-hydroxy-acid oxidizing protein [Thermogemmatispora sp.]MBX5459125.1 alpha-hydroxy-acid oxidizing protein [Thermogemmatispora sp.]